MPTTVKIDPVTRIEGHLAIEVTIDTINRLQQITDAKSNGTLFRGFEPILQGRHRGHHENLRPATQEELAEVRRVVRRWIETFAEQVQPDRESV